MGSFCVKKKHTPSEISVPIKQPLFFSNKMSIMLSLTQIQKSSIRKYSKTKRMLTIFLKRMFLYC